LSIFEKTNNLRISFDPNLFEPIANKSGYYKAKDEFWFKRYSQVVGFFKDAQTNFLTTRDYDA
jgi:hypothetical protein